MQRNARIESESILMLLCVVTSVNAKAMQHNTVRVALYCELAFMHVHVDHTAIILILI